MFYIAEKPFLIIFEAKVQRIMQTKKDTKTQFHTVLAQFRKMFVDKMKDYGPRSAGFAIQL